MADLITSAYDEDQFREWGHDLVDMLADHIKEVRNNSMKAIPFETPGTQLEFWINDFDSPLLENPKELFTAVIERSVKLHSPRYFGHQTSAPALATILASMVIELLNNGMGVYEMGMAGNAIEKVVMDHLASKMGYNSLSSGLVTSGGTLGNLTALLAARSSVTDTWSKGHTGGPPLAIMVSEQAHYSVDRAAKIMGLGDEGIIKIPVNKKYKIRHGLLDEYYQDAVKNGQKVFCMVASAGSTATGSYDDIDALGDFCNRNGIWLHTDGAHGGAVIFSRKYRHLVKGLSKSDSVLVDFHKMMMTPSLSTALLFKKKEYATRTFAQEAHYLWSDQESDEWYHSGKRTFECTKPMSALKVYTLLRIFGDRLFSEQVERTYDLAKKFAALLRERNDFELAYEPESNIVCFRFINTPDPDKINYRIRQALVEDGRFYIVQTMLNGKIFLRISIMNALTTLDDLSELIGSIVKIEMLLHEPPDLLLNK